MLVSRRAALAGVGSTVIAPAMRHFPMAEQRLGPRAQLAWSALNVATGRHVGENGGVRMPMCSSFKWLLAAFVYARVDKGVERLDARVDFGRYALLGASPITEAAVKAGGGRATMTVAALSEAILTVSDNAAANLLLTRVGGPAALTAWLRSIGDTATSVNRTEPTLNQVPRGDLRDSTTPDQTLANLGNLLLGKTLSTDSRVRLSHGMLACRTGATRLTAGLPTGWRIGHRTGTRDTDPTDGPNDRAAAVDVGVLLPPRGSPILIAAYAAGWTRPLPEVEAWFAGVAREAVTRLLPPRAG